MNDYQRRISDTLVFRTARPSDIPSIADILRKAVERMLAEGKHQWDENYPNETHARADIERGIGYVLESEGEVAGYAAVVFTGEPAYADIDGRWLTDGEYVVVHRLAVSQQARGKGFGRACLQAVAGYARERGVPSFRIDTNYDNFAMLGLLERLGFTYCGEIRYESGLRRAFEKPL